MEEITQQLKNMLHPQPDYICTTDAHKTDSESFENDRLVKRFLFLNFMLFSLQFYYSWRSSFDLTTAVNPSGIESSPHCPTTLTVWPPTLKFHFGYFKLWMCMYGYVLKCAVTKEVRGGHEIIWGCIYSWLWAAWLGDGSWTWRVYVRAVFS